MPSSIRIAPLAVKFYHRRAFWRNFIPSFGFLYIVPTSATASFGVKFYFRPQPVFNRAVCFVANFTAVHARFNRRLFIAKCLLEIKLVATLTLGFYLVSATACKPQILNLTRAALCQIFRQNFTRYAAESDLLPKALPARAKLMR